MYETIGCLFSLGVVAVLVAGVVWLVRGVGRSRRLEQRITELEVNLAALRQEWSDPRSSATRTPADAAQRAVAASEELSTGSEVAATATAPPPVAPPLQDAAYGVPDDVGQVPGPAEASEQSELEDGSSTLSTEEPREPEQAQQAGESADPEADHEVAEPMDPGPQPEDGPPDPPAPVSTIDWEQWIGVRGAAVLGGIAFALAGIYLVRLGVEQGLLSPTVRVSIGLVGGILALVSSEFLRTRSYTLVANALAGAGIVCLFAATWAARNLYELIGDLAAALVFTLLTFCAGVLSLRHRSQLIAVLGLVGGFATPLLTGSERDQPVQLFVYLLVLNAATMWVSRRNRWHILPLLGLAATIFYQALWVFTSMQGRVELGLLLMTTIGFFFLAAGQLMRRFAEGTSEGSDASKLMRRVFDAIALSVPFLFAFYFASQTDLARTSLPLFVLLILLSPCATLLARQHRQPTLSYAAVAATLGIVGAWFWRQAEVINDDPWPMTLSALAMAGLALLAVGQWLLWERARRKATLATGGELETVASAAMASGLSVLLAIFALAGKGPLLALSLPTALLLSAVLLRLAPRFSLIELLVSGPLAALLVGAIHHAAAARGSALSLSSIFLGSTAVVIAATLLLRSRWLAAGRPPQEEFATRERRLPPLALALFATVLGFGLALTPHLNEREALGIGGSLLLLAAVGASWARWGSLWTAMAWLAPLVAWTRFNGSETGLVDLVLLFSCALIWTLWPSYLFSGDLASSRSAHRFAAVVPWLWLPALLEVWRDGLGWTAIASVPIALAGVELVVLRRLITSASRPLDPEHRGRIAWCAATALSLVAVAIPLQLDREWITVGWALQVLAVAAIWRRLDHPGLKLFAALLASAVFMRLVVNPAVFDYYPVRAPFGLPVLNWLLYGYLVPAAALLWARSLFVDLEAQRFRPRELAMATRRGVVHPLVSNLLGAQGIVIVFVWINLAILDAFAPGRTLELDLQRLPLRDLTLSLAWVAYAIALLVIGLLRSGRGLRWASLLVMLAALAKVFFYDLGELSGIFRVLSLLGVSLALIGISLLYQRFVFRRDVSREAAATAHEE